MKLFSLLALLFVALQLSAQTVEFKASAPNVVAVGERFQLTYSVNSQGSNLQVPTFENFDLLMGPSPSQSIVYVNNNGRQSQQVSFTYTYLLEGVKEGTFQIPPATITVEGKQYKSNALKIQVVKGESKPAADNSQAAQANSSSINEENLFVRIEVSRRNLYMGESLMAVLKVYSKVDLTNFGRGNPHSPAYRADEGNLQRADIQCWGDPENVAVSAAYGGDSDRSFRAGMYCPATGDGGTQSLGRLFRKLPRCACHAP